MNDGVPHSSLSAPYFSSYSLIVSSYRHLARFIALLMISLSAILFPTLPFSISFTKVDQDQTVLNGKHSSEPV